MGRFLLALVVGFLAGLLTFSVVPSEIAAWLAFGAGMAVVLTLPSR